jgi:cardiolipin synthase
MLAGYVDDLALFVLIGAVLVSALVTAGHALLYKRDPRSALGWIVVCLGLPVAGPLLYWMLGINRIHRRAQSWLESGRRIAGGHDLASRADEPPLDELPASAGHLVELRALADQVVNAPLVGGNRLEPLHNGEAAYPAMLAALAGAESTIHLSTYIFDTDAVGEQFTTALRAAAARGVTVRLIIDGLGEKYSRPSVRRLLAGSGVRVERFLPLRQGAYINLRSHRKILVIDGRVAFTGGMNIGGRHMVMEPSTRYPVQDCHFRVEGPVVNYLQRAFLDDWYFAAGELLQDAELFPQLPPYGSSIVRSISDGPDKEYRKLHWIIMGALACAQRRVCIMTPYFIPDRAMIAALATAAMRGIVVDLLLPATNNLPFVHWASRAYLWEVLKHGVRVHYQPGPFVHTKLFLVDDCWCLIGSANLDPRSLRLNFEYNLEVYDEEFAAAMSRHFAAALVRCREVFLADIDGRPIWERLRDGAAKLFSPYL